MTAIQPPDLETRIAILRKKALIDDLEGQSRSKGFAYPRQVAMSLSRELTDESLPKIGKAFGGRDHSTVMHATAKIANLINSDRDAFSQIHEITHQVKSKR